MVGKNVPFGRLDKINAKLLVNLQMFIAGSYPIHTDRLLVYYASCLQSAVTCMF